MNPRSRTHKSAKAYENLRFLKSADARTIRVLAEYLEPLTRLRRLRVRDIVVIFGSSKLHSTETLRTRHQAARKRFQESGGTDRAAKREMDRMKRRLEMAHFYEEAVELARLLTEWAGTLSQHKRFVICTGAGPGIMEAANRGARERAGGLTAGFNISLPDYQPANTYVSDELLFEFHYFFMRKYWFVYMAAALIVFPGGFGTLDELFEILTLKQTNKVDRPLPIVIYGSKHWKSIINWDELARLGMVEEEDLQLFHFCDTPQEAFEYLKGELTKHYLHGVR